MLIIIVSRSERPIGRSSVLLAFGNYQVFHVHTISLPLVLAVMVRGGRQVR